MNEYDDLKYKIESLQYFLAYSVMIIMALLLFISYKLTNYNVLAILGLLASGIGLVGVFYDIYREIRHKKTSKVKNNA